MSDAMRAHSWAERGFLLYDGGWPDQPQVFIRAMEVVTAAHRLADREESKVKPAPGTEGV